MSWRLHFPVGVFPTNENFYNKNSYGALNWNTNE